MPQEKSKFHRINQALTGAINTVDQARAQVERIAKQLEGAKANLAAAEKRQAELEAAIKSSNHDDVPEEIITGVKSTTNRKVPREVTEDEARTLPGPPNVPPPKLSPIKPK